MPSKKNMNLDANNRDKNTYKILLNMFRKYRLTCIFINKPQKIKIGMIFAYNILWLLYQFR